MKMKTLIKTVSREHPEEEVIEEAAQILRAGGLVAFPTETVYGLGGDALNPLSSRKIYAAKGRPSDNPLIVHIADMEYLPPIVREIPEKARILAERFWPGPLTMIFRKTERIPDETSGGLSTVAVRMPSDPVAAALIRASGGYVAAPSANTSGRPSTTRASHVTEDLMGRIDMILDGGDADIGLESTIVDCTEPVPVILRPGYISRGMLEEAVGEVRIDPGILDENAGRNVRPKAPGMRYRHYAPKAPVTIVEGAPEDVVRTISRLTAEAARKGLKTGVLAAEETASRYRADLVCPLGSLSDEDAIAQHLFAALRDFDSEGCDVIFSEAFETPRIGAAIMNRLLKAAGHRTVPAEEGTEPERV